MRLVSTLQPATRAQFREGDSNWGDTPFLQATTFEHEHEHEREALGEGEFVMWICPGVETPGPVL